MPPKETLAVGDRVSILCTAWGEEYAKSINSRSWKTIRYEGTVLAKTVLMGCQFHEPNGEYSSWKPTDLEFVSRPAAAPAPAAGAGGSGGANGNDDDDDEPDNDADNNEEDGELAEHNDGAAPASVDGWNRNDYFSLPQRTRCWSRHAPRRARDPRKRGLTLMAGDADEEDGGGGGTNATSPPLSMFGLRCAAGSAAGN